MGVGIETALLAAANSASCIYADKAILRSLAKDLRRRREELETEIDKAGRILGDWESGSSPSEALTSARE